MKRKIIKLLSLLLIVLSVYEIYNNFKVNKINYVSLEEGITSYGDYLNDYLKDKIRTDNKYPSMNIAYKIKNNNKIKRNLRESDLVTYLTNNNNLETKLKEIRKYAKKDLIVIGYYDIGNLCITYRCKYIKINKESNPMSIANKIIKM